MTSSSICSRARDESGVSFRRRRRRRHARREGGGRDFACRTHRVGDVWLVSGSGVGLEALESRSADGLPRAADLQVGTADSGDSASGGDGNSGVHSLWFLLVRSRGVDRDLGVVLEVGLLLGALRCVLLCVLPPLPRSLRFGDWVLRPEIRSRTRRFLQEERNGKLRAPSFWRGDILEPRRDFYSGRHLHLFFSLSSFSLQDLCTGEVNRG